MPTTPPIPQPRQGQAPAPLDRVEFHLQFIRSFADPTFDAVRGALVQV
ncbi:MAG: NADPH-dependent FMN reductase, partial [Janthinobacterium lividum]|nr:NADPH-dependent FMN reductase [Janthinobacterium lividum]